MGPPPSGSEGGMGLGQGGAAAGILRERRDKRRERDGSGGHGGRRRRGSARHPRRSPRQGRRLPTWEGHLPLPPQPDPLRLPLRPPAHRPSAPLFPSPGMYVTYFVSSPLKDARDLKYLSLSFLVQKTTVEVTGHKAHGPVPQPGSVVIARV